MSLTNQHSGQPPLGLDEEGEAGHGDEEAGDEADGGADVPHPASSTRVLANLVAHR